MRLSVCLDELLAFTQDGLHRQIVIYLRQHPYRLAPIQGVLTVPVVSISYIIFNVSCNCSKLLYRIVSMQSNLSFEKIAQ